MKLSLRFLSMTLGLSLSLLNVALANENGNASSSAPAARANEGKLVPIADTDAAWLAKAKSEYPITTCIVSGEGLSSRPDEAFDFIYRREGKADRLISFCCEGCSKDFGHDAQRFIQMLDEAAAAKK